METQEGIFISLYPPLKFPLITPAITEKLAYTGQPEQLLVSFKSIENLSKIAQSCSSLLTEMTYIGVRICW
jgi:hypothetical protein